jgi:hypothetical protein
MQNALLVISNLTWLDSSKEISGLTPEGNFSLCRKDSEAFAIAKRSGWERSRDFLFSRHTRFCQAYLKVTLRKGSTNRQDGKRYFSHATLYSCAFGIPHCNITSNWHVDSQFKENGRHDRLRYVEKVGRVRIHGLYPIKSLQSLWLTCEEPSRNPLLSLKFLFDVEKASTDNLLITAYESTAKE